LLACFPFSFSLFITLLVSKLENEQLGLLGAPLLVEAAVKVVGHVQQKILPGLDRQRVDLREHALLQRVQEPLEHHLLKEDTLGKTVLVNKCYSKILHEKILNCVSSDLLPFMVGQSHDNFTLLIVKDVM
jgi:hypothetical protein